MDNIAVIGVNGAIGNALLKRATTLYPEAAVYGFSRQSPPNPIECVVYKNIDYSDEKSIEQAAAFAAQNKPLDMVIVATGFLHNDEIMPEKSLRDLSAQKFHTVFEVNTIVPALVAKHFLPFLNRDKWSVFAALSARVGSISDNRLGGWYAYRASKAALNMIIKNTAIEIGRRNKNAVIVGLHPGTVNSPLSQPFQGNVPDEKLFTPEYSAEKLLNVLSMLTPQQTGKCFAWDGQEVPA
jgi:NAD(P)-dependent dehydrogenase (short-subunit alcohol dehydrogenase family)